jgi:hypothetical protein
LVRQVTTGEVVRSITGHVTRQMTEHYSHIAVAEKHAAVNQVLCLVSGQSGQPSGQPADQLDEEKKKNNDRALLRA